MASILKWAPWALAGMVMSTPTIAQTSPLALTPFLGAGLTFGGETLATTYYDNGDSQDVTTGGLVDLRAGIEYRLTNSPVALQMAVAYHVGNTTAKNGSLKFSRFPVELVGMYDFGNQWRVGFGIRQATGAKVSASGDAVYQAGYGASTSFKADTGALIQLEYRVSPQVGIQARYVKESYTVQDYTHQAIDGSHGGVFGVFYFN
jgi:hypothetical protein